MEGGRERGRGVEIVDIGTFNCLQLATVATSLSYCMYIHIQLHPHCHCQCFFYKCLNVRGRGGGSVQTETHVHTPVPYTVVDQGERMFPYIMYSRHVLCMLESWYLRHLPSFSLYTP